MAVRSISPGQSALPLCDLVSVARPSVAASAARRRSQSEDVEIALSLANLLRSARAVISANQDLINNPDIGEKGRTSDVVLEKAFERYQAETGTDPRSVDPASRHGRLLAAQIEAITNVMDANQATINRQGQGFKASFPPSSVAWSTSASGPSSAKRRRSR